MAEAYGKRAAEGAPEAQPVPLKRRPNNWEDSTVDPVGAPNDRPEEARRPTRVTGPTQPTPPTPAPLPERRATVTRHPIDLGALPALPDRVVYRRPTTTTGPTEPVHQIKSLPMKLSVQTYLNHVSDDEFERVIAELKESRSKSCRTRKQSTAGAQEEVVTLSSSTSEDGPKVIARQFIEAKQPTQNLQRAGVTTTVARVPVLINGVVFEDGVIDTGATNTMMSQAVARRLNLWDQIEPSRLKFLCADGKSSAPWGVLRRLTVGVDGLEIPLDVYVSGATTYDILLGTDWLSQAKADISFSKQEMTFRIDPYLVGRVGINVGNDKTSSR